MRESDCKKTGRQAEDEALRDALHSLRSFNRSLPAEIRPSPQKIRDAEELLVSLLCKMVTRRREAERSPESEDRARSFLAWLIDGAEGDDYDLRISDILAAPAGQATAFLGRSLTRFLYEQKPEEHRQLRTAVNTAVRERMPDVHEDPKGKLELRERVDCTWPGSIWLPGDTERFDHAALAQVIRIVLEQGGRLSRSQITTAIERAIQAGHLRYADEQFDFAPQPADHHRRRHDAEVCVRAVVDALEPRELLVLRAKMLGESAKVIANKLDLERAQTYKLLGDAQHKAGIAIRMSYGGTPSLLSQEAINELLIYVFQLQKATEETPEVPG